METLLTRISAIFHNINSLKTFPSHIKFKTQHFISDQLSKVQLGQQQQQQLQKLLWYYWIVTAIYCEDTVAKISVFELMCPAYLHVFLAVAIKACLVIAIH